MNVYASLNQMLDYIELHLNETIDYEVLSRFLGVNVYTMERFFSLLVNMTLTEYIRNRRLSVSFYDLYYGKEKIIDVAFKYGYNNPTSFSRAFVKFHGIKPSEVRKGNAEIRNFPKFHFEEKVEKGKSLKYSIRNLDAFTLYGKGKKVTNLTIGKEAPLFFAEMKKKYGLGQYGMVVYEKRFHSDNYEYWVLNKEYQKGLDLYEIPASKWLVFRINSLEASDIQELSAQFYFHFLPSCRFNLRDIPEIEVYYDDYMEFLIPIES